MNKTISILLMSALGMAPVVYGDNCTFNYRPLAAFENHWPTMPIQETPGTQAFCAMEGAISQRITNTGTLTKVLGLKSYYTNHWVVNPNHPNRGYFDTNVFVEVNVNGTPVATLDVNVSNHVNGRKPCRISTNGGTEPNQTTFSFGPNLDMDLIRETPNGLIKVEDNFIYGEVNSMTNLVDTFTNLRNNNFSIPSVVDPTLVELYYNRVADIATCPVYSENQSQSKALPNLEADLNKVWVLEGGITMTGAEIRKLLVGY